MLKWKIESDPDAYADLQEAEKAAAAKEKAQQEAAKAAADKDKK